MTTPQPTTNDKEPEVKADPPISEGSLQSEIPSENSPEEEEEDFSNPREDGKFVYTNCLRRKYDDTVENIYSVEFHISRYGQFSMVLSFGGAPTTELKAVLAAEAYLSKPLTQEWYDEIKGDTFHRMTWEEAKESFTCRGDTLTDAVFLEVAKRNSRGRLTLWCGS